MKKSNAIPVIIFLIGLFSQTQIYVGAFADISELFAFVFGPYFFLIDYTSLKRHKFTTFLWLWILTVFAAILVSWMDGLSLFNYARGVMTPLAVVCLISVFHHFLSRDFGAFKWFFLGSAISGVLCLFVFQRGTARTGGGEWLSNADALEHAVTYSLFWFVQLATWLTLPFFFNYLKTPKLYILAVCVFLLAFSVFSAGSRSSLGVLSASCFLLLIGGKTQEKMMFVKKHFLLMSLLAVISIPLFATTYKFMAVNGHLGEGAYEKYKKQSERGSGMLALLMSGRSGFFMGFMAALEHPWLGHGYNGIDKSGVVGRYLEKFGTDGELEAYRNVIRKYGFTTIPTHSWVMSFWEWYGLAGLFAMLYVGWLMFSTLKDRLHVVPELYGYFAYFIVGQIWAWLFSPFGGRTNAAFFFTLMLFVRAIQKGRYYFMSSADEQPWCMLWR